MKYKKLTKSQIIISIDRLTRFKNPEEKYLRVFKDIIISNLIEPKYKKHTLDEMSYEQIRDIAVEIFNSSLENSEPDLYINQYLKDYETKIFHISKDGEILLENRLNYSNAIKLLSNDIPENIKWLKDISKKEEILEKRNTNGTLFPIEKVVIVEGITEEVLLPKFSNICGYDFNKNGIKVISAGGKNQVVKLYYRLSEELKLPIFVLLDKDAEANEELINHKLRKQDKVHLLDSGEFEDILPKELIVKTINNEFKNFVKTSKKELFAEDLPTVKILEEFFKDKCLHEFKKAEFANRVEQQTTSEKDISEEVKTIIKEVEIL